MTEPRAIRSPLSWDADADVDAGATVAQYGAGQPKWSGLGAYAGRRFRDDDAGQYLGGMTYSIARTRTSWWWPSLRAAR